MSTILLYICWKKRRDGSLIDQNGNAKKILGKFRTKPSILGCNDCEFFGKNDRNDKQLATKKHLEKKTLFIFENHTFRFFV